MQTLYNLDAQTRRPDEIVVVDDHSTDGTKEAVQAAFGNRVIVISNSGKGPGTARNAGLKVSTGDYIKFFDSDDVMTANTLEAQLEVLKRSGRGFVYSPYFKARQEDDLRWMPVDSVIMHYYPFHKRLPLWHFMIDEGLFIAIPGMLFRRALLERTGCWREDATAYEDWDYLFRVALLEPFPAHTHACAFIYRMHGTQTTLDNLSDLQRDLDKAQVLEALSEAIDADNRFGFFARQLFRNKLYQLYRDSSDRKLQERLKKYDTFFHRLTYTGLRMKLAVGRRRTGTDWQPAHGPFVSPQHVNQYLQQVTFQKDKGL